MKEIRLEWYEVSLAATVGVRRQIEAIRLSLPDAYGFNGEGGFQIHIDGALAEMAFAKATGRYWNGSINTFKSPDVGSIQVRYRSKPHYDLIVRDSDPDDDLFVLVLGSSFSAFSIVGWIHSRLAKRTEWLQSYANRPPAYFVPQSALLDIDSLP